MRDASASYWFRINDRVQVIDDFIKGGVSLRGMQGQVVETWEKCDVDPTCCCAEQVDTNMAVRVEFSASLLTDSTDESSSFFHYFAEDELVKVMDDAKIADANSNQPFNGMSCTAFKLEQLKSSRPRKIASFDPSQLNSDE